MCPGNMRLIPSVWVAFRQRASSKEPDQQGNNVVVLEHHSYKVSDEYGIWSFEVWYFFGEASVVAKMVEGEGFEPSKAVPADLQSDPFGHSGTPPHKNWCRLSESNG